MKKFWAVKKLSDDSAEILLYGYIDQFAVSAGDFIKELRSLEKDYAKINVRINSAGGDVFEGVAIYNAMKQSKAHIETFNDGVAASMGSIILLGGKKVHMSKMARIMIHQASSGGYGTSEELKNMAEVLDGINTMMTAVYASKTGKTVAQVKEKWMNGKDNWLNAQQAKDEGLVDVIYDGEEVEVPATAQSEKEIWSAFDVKFAARLDQQQQNQNKNMKTYTLSAASLAALSITDVNADAPAIDAAITSMAAKLIAAESAKKKAEDDLAEFKKTTDQNEINAEVDKAVAEERCTKEDGVKYKKLFEGRKDDLKEFLGTLKPYKTITSQFDNTGGGGSSEASAEEIKKLMAMSGDELFVTGGFERLKAIHPEGFKAKYKEYFNEEYKEEK